ncbi:MAG: EamA family transporter, partial [Calditrichia bacterium]|nr:EamA family transporter [Calditrichia bacterium]
YVIIKMGKIDLTKLKIIIIFALLEVGIPPYLYSFAQTSVDSSTAGILNSLVPLFTLITGVMFYQSKFSFNKILGVLIGLIGAILLTFTKSGVSSGLNISFDFTNVYGLLIVLATILYGFGGNILKAHLQEVSGLLISAVSFVSMSVPAGIILFSTNILSVDFHNAQVLYSFSAIVVLSLMGSALAIYLFSLLAQKSNALFASFVTYLIPFVAILWGYFDGETLNFIQFLCLFLILFGIYFSHKTQISEMLLKKK